jgi:hypothetical protein
MFISAVLNIFQYFIQAVRRGREESKGKVKGVCMNSPESHHAKICVMNFRRVRPNCLEDNGLGSFQSRCCFAVGRVSSRYLVVSH